MIGAHQRVGHLGAAQTGSAVAAAPEACVMASAAQSHRSGQIIHASVPEM